MAAASWKGSVQMGPMLMIPMIAKSAVREEKFAFNTHHATDGGRLRQQMPVCEVCTEDVSKEEVVRGFNGKPGIDDEYLKGLELAKSSIMTLDGFVSASEIDARMYAKSYTMQPDVGGEKAYLLLLRTMEKQHKVAVGKVVMGGKEYIVALRPREGVIAMEVMYWPAEIRADADEEARMRLNDVGVTAQELKMGEMLVGQLTRKFEPESYVNQYAESVKEYLTAFLADETPRALPAAPKASKATLDLAAQLEASLAAIGGAAAEKVEAKKGRKKVAA